MKRYFLQVATLILLLTAAVSCAKHWDDTDPDNPNGGDGNSEVVLTINTPSGFSSGAATRGLTPEQETQIDNVWVLVFSAADNLLTEIREGANIKPTAGTTSSTFTATLKQSTSDDDKYRLMVLTNASDIINATIGTDIEKIADKEYAKIIAQLNKEIVGKMYTATTSTIPMWGESDAVVVKRALNSNLVIKMMRSVARIDVGVGTPVTQADFNSKWDGVDKDGKKIPFELKEVFLVKPNNRYAVVPLPENVQDNSGKLSAIKPTIPTGTTAFTMEESTANFHFTEAGGEITPSTTIDEKYWGSYTQRQIYLPEMEIAAGKSGDGKHEDRMAIIVGGQFNGSTTTTYYRLDFAIDGDILDVLRNHLYRFNINKVSGAGYADVATAYKSLSLNMHAELLKWDDVDMNDIVFDGQYYFSIESRKVEFSPMGNETQTLKIKTNAEGFEMLETQEDKSQVLRLKASKNGTATYKNDDMGYEYSLSNTEGDMYQLTIKATKHNVAQTKPNRHNEWSLKINRLNASFEVDQQNTLLYISYVNGESKTLFPEGTTADVKVPIEIMALVPVRVVADGWIKLGSDVGSNGYIAKDANGLYTARIDAVVDPYATGQTDRSGTISISPDGEEVRVFTITQQAPFLKFVNHTENITRSKSNYDFKGYVEVLTNILSADLKISRTDEQGIGNERIQFVDKFYNVDNTRPRYMRFDVTADMTTTTGVIPASKFSADFTVTADVAKYGTITSPTVKFTVDEAAILFNWFWYNGTMVDPAKIWTAPVDDVEKYYIFPWQTKSITYKVISSIGAKNDPNHANNLYEGGSVVEDPVEEKDGNKVYPLTFSFNNGNYNMTKNYALYFKSDPAFNKPKSDYIMFKQGSQLWSKTSPGSTITLVGHKGVAESINTSTRVQVTNNVLWNVFTANTPWLTMRAGTSGAWVSPTESTPLVSDDRSTEPKLYDSAKGDGVANALLSNVTSLYFGIAPLTTLNASPTTRTATVYFDNKSYDEAKGGVKLTTQSFNVMQYAPVLDYSSGVPSANIPAVGESRTFTVTTNVQSWGIKVHEGSSSSGTLLGTYKFGTSPVISDKTAITRTVSVVVPRTNKGTNSRSVSFFVFHEESGVSSPSVKVGSTCTQDAVPTPPSTDYVKMNGLNWANGNLVADGKGGCVISKNNADCGLYFHFGSLVGWSGGYNNNGTGTPFASTALAQVVTPAGYSGSKTWPSGYTTSGNIPTIFEPSAGKGDPCSYYLGGSWRLPTSAEYKKLLSNVANGTLWANCATGAWHLTPVGAFLGPKAKTHDYTQAIYAPASGYRDVANGLLHSVNANLFLLSSTANGNASAYYFNSNVGAVNPQESNVRGYAFPVRCVSE